jgi:hypothetical protein
LLVRGSGRNSKLDADTVENAIKILDQLVIAESFHAKTLVLQKLYPSLIGDDVFRCTVLASIEFDNQLDFETDKIGDVRADRLLTTKLESTESAIAKRIPELTLDIGLAAAKLTGEVVFHKRFLTCTIS